MLADPLFKRLFLLAEIGRFTAAELQQYQQSLENMGDYDNIINTAKEEAEKIGWALGHEQGLAKGLTEGRAEAFVEMAQKMLAAGLPVEQISQLTGLSAEEIDVL